MFSKLVLPEAYNQFVKTLKWRKEFNPLSAADEKHDAVYDTVGYVVGHDKKGRLITYNLYGGLDNEAVPLHFPLYDLLCLKFSLTYLSRFLEISINSFDGA